RRHALYITILQDIRAGNCAGVAELAAIALEAEALHVGGWFDVGGQGPGGSAASGTPNPIPPDAIVHPGSWRHLTPAQVEEQRPRWAALQGHPSAGRPATNSPGALPRASTDRPKQSITLPAGTNVGEFVAMLLRQRKASGADTGAAASDVAPAEAPRG